MEGCYADLLKLVKPIAKEAIFMNLLVYLCQENARHRSWEPHRYQSRRTQDDNLAILIDWIAGYLERSDSLSYKAHLAPYECFQWMKTEIFSNEDVHYRAQRKTIERLCIFAQL